MSPNSGGVEKALEMVIFESVVSERLQMDDAIEVEGFSSLLFLHSSPPSLFLLFWNVVFNEFFHDFDNFNFLLIWVLAFTFYKLS